MRRWLGGRPSERHDELRPATCMSCGRGVRLNPSLPIAVLEVRHGCRCGAFSWRVDLGAGEPDQLITLAFPQPFAQRDRLRPSAAQPGRGLRLTEALSILRHRGQQRGQG
jgi:hypothetical protein